MFCRHLVCAAGLLAVAGGVSCGRRASGPQRLAVLRLENLGNPADDWIGLAIGEVAAHAIGRGPGISAVPLAKVQSYNAILGTHTAGLPGISAARTQALMAGANRVGYGWYAVRNGRLEGELAVEDPAAVKRIRTVALAGPAADPIALGEALARQLGGRGRPYSTRNAEALHAYVSASDAAESGPPTAALEAALRFDPAYVPAALSLSRILAAGNDRAGAERVLRAALAGGGGRLSAADRARLEINCAALNNDSAARRHAVAELAKAEPNDPAVWLTAAEDATARHEPAEAFNAYRKAAALEPEDAPVLNAMGYAAVHAGDLPAAVEALRRYEKLRPQEANPLDSLGDVHYYTGRFREAEEFYQQAHQRDPRFMNGAPLFKASIAHLMTGDAAGAEAVAQRFWQVRDAAKDPALDYRKAEWFWAAGRRREAIGYMLGFARRMEGGAGRDLAARAYAHAAVWKLLTGDTEGAATVARQAGTLATPASAGVAVLAQFMAQPKAGAAEWKARGERAFPNPAQEPFRTTAVAYALLLAKEYAAALPLLQQLYASPASAADEGLPVVLGWAYLETGDTAKAAPLLAGYPAPPATGPGVLSGFHFPRIVHLRGLLAEKQGNREAARAAGRLFLNLSGKQPLLWGEEARAAAGQ